MSGSRRGPRPLAIALGAALLAAGCRRTPPAESFSLVLVTLDTTRADRIGAFGGRAVPTPRIDRLAAEGTIALEAISQVPLTLPSHATILTGRYPASHGVRHNGIYHLRPEEETLAEHLRAAGFHTAAFVGSYVLNRGFGVEQGFETYDDVPVNRFAGGRDQVFEAQRSADEVNAKVREWLEHRPPGRFFLWVHYYDPHDPYAPPESPKRKLAGQGYEREISYVDACLGDLVDALAAKGLLDGALLAVAGDHGESLGEHGEKTHGLFLYEGDVHVPLLLRAPGLVPEGRAIRGPVELADLAPTVLDYLKLAPLAKAEGRSLKARIEGSDDGKLAVAHAETLMPRLEFGWSDLAMVRDARFKYVRAPRPELYDLRDDPAEARDLSASDAERAGEMGSRLAAWESAARGAGTGDDAASRRPLDPDEEARLRSLGYLSGTAFKEGDGAAGSVDPKDGIAELRALDEARDRLAEGDPDGALARVAPILKANPSNHEARATRILALVDKHELAAAEDEALQALALAGRGGPASERLATKARGLLASVYRLAGKDAAAEREYRRLLADDAENEPVAVDLARLLVETKRLDEAAALLDPLLARDPRNGMALAARFELATARGDDEARLAAARAMADEKTGDAATLLAAGRLLGERKEYARAAACLEVAVDLMPRPDPVVLGQLGVARLAAGDLARAEEAFRAGEALAPGDPRPVYYLGLVASRRGDAAAARREFERALALEPRFGPARDALARLDAPSP